MTLRRLVPGGAGLLAFFFLCAGPALVLGAPGSVVAAPQRMAIARGTVTDQDGNPLPGVKVSIEFWYLGPRLGVGAQAVVGAGDRIDQTEMQRSAFDIETREDGTFSYPDLEPNVEYRVRLEKDGFIPREEKKILHVAANDLGTLVMISGDVEAARDAYEKGYEAFQSRQFPDAIAAMEEVVDVYRDSDSSDEMLTVALGVLGQCYLQLGQPADAEAALTRLMEIKPGDPIAHRGLGQVSAMKGQMPQAIDHFALAVELEPEHATGRYLLGFALQLAGQPAEAIPHLQACLEAEPGYVAAHKVLGFSLADTGETAQAIEHLEAYLEAAPNAPDAAEVQAKLAEIRN